MKPPYKKLKTQYRARKNKRYYKILFLTNRDAVRRLMKQEEMLRERIMARDEQIDALNNEVDELEKDIEVYQWVGEKLEPNTEKRLKVFRKMREKQKQKERW